MRDYAKRNSTKTTDRYRRFSGVMLLMSFVFAACAIFHFVYKHFPLDKKVFLPAPARTVPGLPSRLSQQKGTKASLARKKKSKPAVKTASANNQPRYDFYKLLPRMTVVVPKKDQTSSH